MGHADVIKVNVYGVTKKKANEYAFLKNHKSLLRHL